MLVGAERRTALAFAAAADRSGLTAPDPAVARLVGLADTLRVAARTALPGADPSAEFRATLRRRLVAVASVAPAAEVPEPTRPSVRRVLARPGITAAAAGLAGVVGLSGVAVAADQSLPGQPFYPLKQGAEAVQLVLATSTAAKGERHLEFALTRLREAQELAATGDDNDAASALRAMASETRAASADLTRAYRSDDDPALLARLGHYARTSQLDLHTLLATLSASARPAAVAGMAVLADVDRQVVATLGVPLATQLLGGAGAPGLPGLPGLPGFLLPTAIPPGASLLPGLPLLSSGTTTTNPAPGSSAPATAPSAPTGTSPNPAPTGATSPPPAPGLPLPTPLPTSLPTSLPSSLPTSLPTSLTTPLPTSLPSLDTNTVDQLLQNMLP